jgi:hypothetical protein
MHNKNILILKYEYILHEPQNQIEENYKGMKLQIVIHKVKHLQNEQSIEGAGVDVLKDKIIRAGLEKFKFKRMQQILMRTEGDNNQKDTRNTRNIPMRTEPDNSHMSVASGHNSSLTAVFEKLDLSDSKIRYEYNVKNILD